MHFKLNPIISQTGYWPKTETIIHYPLNAHASKKVNTIRALKILWKKNYSLLFQIITNLCVFVWKSIKKQQL